MKRNRKFVSIKLSIITINLNNKSGLAKTIESIVNQTYKGFEYVVIDGNSTDGSVDLIKDYTSEISLWISEPDTGIYNAMNKGIKKANGEYCLFINSGDILFNENVLENVFENHFTQDIVYGQQFIYKSGLLKENGFLDPEYLTFNSFLSSTLPHQCTFIKRILFDKIGLYNEQNKIVSDWEWNAIALFKFNCTLKKIDLPICIYDTNGISSLENNSITEHLKEKRNAANKNFPRIMKDIDDYNLLISRFKKIPKILRMLINRL